MRPCPVSQTVRRTPRVHPLQAAATLAHLRRHRPQVVLAGGHKADMLAARVRLISGLRFDLRHLWTPTPRSDRIALDELVYLPITFVSHAATDSPASTCGSHMSGMERRQRRSSDMIR
jgi:hypothetical protein